MANQAHPIRVDDEVWNWLNNLPGKTINEGLRSLMLAADKPPVRAPKVEVPAVVDLAPVNRRLDWMTDKLEEILETVQSVPGGDTSTGQSFSPASIPGVQVGAGNMHPRRESGTERAERERRERTSRAAALDPVDDPSIDRSDEFVSQA